MQADDLGGSDFTVSSWAFGKVALLQIDHIEIAVTCEVVLATLKNIKAEIYVIQHKTYSRKQCMQFFRGSANQC